MNQYGTGQNVPYSGQQETDLVNNPRYTGQSAGTNPLGHDGRGPAEESRYGATPLSTTGTTTLPGQAPGGVWPSPAAPPHAHRSDHAGVDEYGNPRREGMADRVKDAVGMGPHSAYDARRDEPGYENYGNPRREGVVGAAGVGPHSGEPGYGTPGYDNHGNPRREGVVGAAGVGPHSGEPGYGTPGYDNHGNPQREGVVDRMKDAAGMGPHTGATRGEDYTNVNPPNHGTGLGNHPHGTTNRYDHSGVGTGFGTGHHQGDVHVVPGTIPVAAMGERRVEPGYDASRGQFGHNQHGTLTGSPRKEGMVEKIKDAVGMGKHDNVAHTHPGTTTGAVLPNTYGTGEPGLLNHGNTATPGSYSHNHMVDTGLGHERHPGSSTGYPHETVGTGHTYPHERMGDAARDSSLDSDSERRGTRFENTTGMMHDNKTGPGYDATRTGAGTGYDDTNAGYPHNDATAYGVEGAPPKKGIMTKIKEKLHH